MSEKFFWEYREGAREKARRIIELRDRSLNLFWCLGPAKASALKLQLPENQTKALKGGDEHV